MELIKMRKTFLFVLVLTGMVFGLSGVAFAQDACDPTKEECPCDPTKEKCEPPKEGTPCSPGFFKNHTDFWIDEFCDSAGGECAALLAALNCTGKNQAACGGADARQGAADTLNERSGCTESD